MLSKHEADPQENNNAEARSQQSRLTTLLKAHPRTDPPPKIRCISAEYPHPVEHLWGTASACQKKLIVLDYKMFCFTVVKRNLLTLKMNT